jgi:hypothetical protein
LGYKVISFLSVSSTDGHEYFLYYLPARGMASLWLNQWINSNFDRLASELGPRAVLITSPEGAEDSFLESARGVQGLLDASLRADEDNFVLHEGAPMLLISRLPLRADQPQDTVECAAINLAAYDPNRLAELFDHLIVSTRKGEDPIDGIPLADVKGSPPRYGYSEVLELKPNIFGVGVNGNAVIEMLKRWRQQRRSGPKRF